MGNGTHFFGQPMYNPIIKLLDESKILQISLENCGGRYKQFNGFAGLMSNQQPDKWYIYHLNFPRRFAAKFIILINGS